ncbi:hypothetical protein chiPu_0033435, partial [Chiloscyllium punctatum]|nr:hypothetical protein [Chiloscyllium punctatum]
HQRAECGDAHHAPDEHRQPRVRYVDEHDLHGGALLVVIGRHRRLVEPDREQDRGRACEPRQDARSQRQKPGRVGEVGQRLGQLHGTLIVVRCVAGNWPNSSRKDLIWLISIQPVPQAGSGRKRADHEAGKRQRAEDRERCSKRQRPRYRRLRGCDAEDQHRDRQRQHQHRQQQSAA